MCPQRHFGRIGHLFYYIYRSFNQKGNRHKKHLIKVKHVKNQRIKMHNINSKCMLDYTNDWQVLSQNQSRLYPPVTAQTPDWTKLVDSWISMGAALKFVWEISSHFMEAVHQNVCLDKWKVQNKPCSCRINLNLRSATVHLNILGSFQRLHCIAAYVDND